MKDNIALINNTILDSIPNLAERSVMISIEEFELIKKVSKFLSDKFNSFLNVFKINNEAISKVTIYEYNVHMKTMLKVKKDLKKVTTSGRYSKVANIPLPVVMGMIVTLPEACSYINKSVKLIDRKLDLHIKDCEVTISKVLSDVDYRTATRANMIHVDEVNEDYKYLNSNINKILQADVVIDRKPISEIIPNLTSLDKSYSDLVEVGMYNNKKNLTKLQSDIAGLTKLTDTLFIELENSDFKISKPVLVRLADKLEVTAKYITTTVSTLHLLDQLSGMTVNVVSSVKKYA